MKMKLSLSRLVSAQTWEHGESGCWTADMFVYHYLVCTLFQVFICCKFEWSTEITGADSAVT